MENGKFKRAINDKLKRNCIHNMQIVVIEENSGYQSQYTHLITHWLPSILLIIIIRCDYKQNSWPTSEGTSFYFYFFGSIMASA